MIEREFDEPDAISMQPHQPISTLQQKEVIQTLQPLEEHSIDKDKISERAETERSEDLEQLIDSAKENLNQLSQEHNKEYINNFRVIDYLGSGGIGDVYLVEQESTGARFAYKELNSERVKLASHQNPEAANLFLGIMRKSAKLAFELGKEHPDKFSSFVLDYTASERPGILRQYYPKTLEDKLNNLTDDDKKSYFLQVAEQIKILHDKGIVLADIKPSQFGVDKDKLSLLDFDFYSSDFKDISTMIHSAAFSLVGKKSGVLGTPRYMAPEQWEILEGKEGTIDKRTDIYQLSSLLYELWMGHKQEGSYEHITGKFEPLDKVILKGRSRKKEDRFSNAEELIKAFKEAIGYEERRKETSPVKSLETLTENGGMIKREVSFVEVGIKIDKVIRKNNYFFNEYKDIIEFNSESKNAQKIGDYFFVWGDDYDQLGTKKVKLRMMGEMNRFKLEELAKKISAATGLEVITSLSSETSRVLSKRQTRKLIKQNSLEEKAAQVNVGSLEVAGEMTKSIYKVFGKASKGLFYIATMPFIIPTNIRKFADNESVLGVFGLITAIVSACFTPQLYNQYGREGLLPLSILVTANLASGIYETARHSRNKLLKKRKEEIGNYNREEILKKVEAGDFSFLVRDNKFRSREQESLIGRAEISKILKIRYDEAVPADKVYKRLIDNGVADNIQTAEKIMQYLIAGRYEIPVRGYYLLVNEEFNSRGEKGYQAIFSPEDNIH